MTDLATLTTPRKVMYCDICGMNPEYCSYGPDFESHCVPWLKRNLTPDKFRECFGDTTTTAGGGAANDGAVAAGGPPSQPWSTRERLVAFYTDYQPDKLDGVDGILDKYAGREDKLFAALVKKYGPEPEDPYYASAVGSDDGENDMAGKMDALAVSGDKKKRRGASAKKVNRVDTRVVVQKISRNRRKAVTHVVGMDTVPGMKLKEASKAFSKRFAGSSSVKGDEIIIQGDHLEDVARMIVSKFGVSEDAVFLDLDGEFVPFRG